LLSRIWLPWITGFGLVVALFWPVSEIPEVSLSAITLPPLIVGCAAESRLTPVLLLSIVLPVTLAVEVWSSKPMFRSRSVLPETAGLALVSRMPVPMSVALSIVQPSIEPLAPVWNRIPR
jgi:hypothetical protein